MNLQRTHEETLWVARPCELSVCHQACTRPGGALLYQQNQHYAQAEASYQRVLHIDEQVHGQQHPEVATDLGVDAKLLREMDREQEALPLEARTRAIREEERQRS